MESQRPRIHETNTFPMLTFLHTALHVYSYFYHSVLTWEFVSLKFI